MADQTAKSSEPSSTNSELPHSHITFFVDRCLGRGLWKELRARGYNAEHKDDHFPQDCDDSVWIPDVASRGWVIFTRDKNIRKRPDEIAAYQNSGARLFTLQSRKISGQIYIDAFTGHMVAILRLLAAHPGAFIAGVTSTTVKIMHPRQD